MSFGLFVGLSVLMQNFLRNIRDTTINYRNRKEATGDVYLDSDYHFRRVCDNKRIEDHYDLKTGKWYRWCPDTGEIFGERSPVNYNKLHEKNESNKREAIKNGKTVFERVDIPEYIKKTGEIPIGKVYEDIATGDLLFYRRWRRNGYYFNYKTHEFVREADTSKHDKEQFKEDMERLERQRKYNDLWYNFCNNIREVDLERMSNR